MEKLMIYYEGKKDQLNRYLDDLKTIITDSNDPLEGNCFYHHTTLTLYPQLFTKQLNLVWCGTQSITNVCEIGFNAGHSTVLLLLGRETPLNFTIFDINSHLYTKPCFDYIKSKFLNINFEFLEGDSTIIMPEWINNNKHLLGKYDVIHVDGGHSAHCIQNDMKNTDLLIKMNGIVIVDDTNVPDINNCVNLYISKGNYIEIGVLQTYGYPHRIIKKIK